MDSINMSAVYLPLLISISCFIVCIFTFFYLRSYTKRKTAIKNIKDGLLSDIKEEVGQLLSAIDESTERDISLIEERKKELKEFLSSIDVSINEIEKKLKILVKENEIRDASPYIPLSGGIMSGNSLPGAALQNDTTLQNMAQVNYQNLGKNRHKATFPLPEFSIKDETQSEKDKIPVSEQIKDLLMAGFSPPLIASRLGISIAEVEFAAALYEGKNSITGT